MAQFVLHTFVACPPNAKKKYRNEENFTRLLLVRNRVSGRFGRCTGNDVAAKCEFPADNLGYSARLLAHNKAHKGTLHDVQDTMHTIPPEEWDIVALSEILWSMWIMKSSKNEAVSAYLLRVMLSEGWKGSVEDLTPGRLFCILQGCWHLQMKPPIVFLRVAATTFKPGATTPLTTLIGLLEALMPLKGEYRLAFIERTCTQLRGRMDQMPKRALLRLLNILTRLQHRDAQLNTSVAAQIALNREQYGTIEMIHALWALGKLKHRSHELVLTVCDRLQEDIQVDLDNEDVSKLVAGLGYASDLPREALAATLQIDCQLRASEFSAVQLASIVRGFSQMGSSLEYLAGFLPLVKAKVKEMPSYSLADVVRAYVDVGLPANEPLWSLIASQAAVRVGTAIQDVLLITSAYEELGLEPGGPLIGVMEDAAIERLDTLSVPALAAAIASYARLGGASSRLLSKAADCASKCRGLFDSNQLASVIWAFARLGHHPGEDLVSTAYTTLVRDVASFSNKYLAWIVWGLASLGHIARPRDLPGLIEAIQPRIPTMVPVVLANIAWSFATWDYIPSSAFIEVLGDTAAKNCTYFEPQGISILSWSFARFKCCHRPFLTAAVNDCLERKDRLHSFEAQHLANFVWGMIRVGFHPGDEFLEELCFEVQERYNDLQAQEKFNIIWALAKVNHRCQPLLVQAAQQAALHANTFTAQELSGLMWSLARLDAPRKPAQGALEAALIECHHRQKEFEDRHLAMIVWAAGHYGYGMESGKGAWPPFLDILTMRCQSLDEQSFTMVMSGLSKIKAPLPAQLLEGCAQRSAQLLAMGGGTKASFTQMLVAFAKLDYKEALYDLLEPKTEVGQTVLEEAARIGSPVDAIRVLWSMFHVGKFVEPAFGLACRRMYYTSPGYKFKKDDLLMLGLVYTGLEGTAAESRLKLKPALKHAAVKAVIARGSHPS